jgi:electron transport complex protein RnfG
MKDFLRLVMILFITCALAAASLSFINQITKDPIADFEKQEKEEAMRLVSAGADTFKEKIKDRLWEAYKGNKKIGNVILTESQGYSGPIKIIFGLTEDNVITGVKIIKQTETPGLGAKIITTKFTNQYKNLIVDQLTVKKDDPAIGAIDSITGATISSRAVTKGIREALTSFENGIFVTDTAKEGTP